VLLRDHGRSALGARHILNALALMIEDAITDDVAEVNPFRGVRVRANDPRIRKQPRQIRVWSFEDMHRFAEATGPYEGLVRCFSDLGMRLGEALPLQRGDLYRDERGGWLLAVRRTAHEGVVQEGTKTDHGEAGGGRIVPVPPSLLEVLSHAPARIDTPLLHPTPTGKLWRERNFYRDVWQPARAATRLDIRPHEMRHSWISHLRAAGIDDADLADVAGHTVETMLGHYTHALKQSFEAIRLVIG
jgi:integrase